MHTTPRPSLPRHAVTCATGRHAATTTRRAHRRADDSRGSIHAPINVGTAGTPATVHGRTTTPARPIAMHCRPGRP